MSALNTENTSMRLTMRSLGGWFLLVAAPTVVIALLVFTLTRPPDMADAQRVLGADVRVDRLIPLDGVHLALGHTATDARWATISRRWDSNNTQQWGRGTMKETPDRQARYLSHPVSMPSGTAHILQGRTLTPAIRSVLVRREDGTYLRDMAIDSGFGIAALGAPEFCHIAFLDERGRIIEQVSLRPGSATADPDTCEITQN